MKDGRRTYPWGRLQLIHERYWYLANDQQIEEVYFPGGHKRKVIWQGKGIMELENGQVFRLPQYIRDFIDSWGS